MRLKPLLLAITCSLLVPSLATARLDLGKLGGDVVSFSTTSTLLLEYRHDNFNGAPGLDFNEDDGLLNLIGRLNLTTAWKGFSASVRLDGLQMLYRANPCRLRNDSTPGNQGLPICRRTLKNFDYRVGEFQVSYRMRYLSVTAGHVTAQFGRGLALSIRKVDELGRDQSLLGGRAQLRAGPITVTLVGGGMNTNEIDFATLEFSDDLYDIITGARIEANIAGKANIGAHFVFSHLLKTPDLEGFSRYFIPGLTFQIPQLGKYLSLEVEGALMVHEASTQAEGIGYAVFAALTGIFGAWSTLLEMKYYSKFRFGSGVQRSLLYHEPPSLERLDQQVPNNSNVFGGRIRAAVALWDDKVTPSINALLYVLNDRTDQDLFGDDSSRMVYHVYFEVEQKIARATLTLSFGIRRDIWVNREGTDIDPRLYRKVVRMDGSFTLPLGRHSIEAKWEHRAEVKQVFSALRFLKGRATLTYGYSPHFTFALLSSWDTSADVDVQPHFLFGAEAQVRIGRWAQIKVFGGGLHGGLVCVSGSCRTLPTFTGVRSEFVLRI